MQEQIPAVFCSYAVVKELPNGKVHHTAALSPRAECNIPLIQQPHTSESFLFALLLLEPHKQPVPSRGQFVIFFGFGLEKNRETWYNEAIK